MDTGEITKRFCQIHSCHHIPQRHFFFTYVLINISITADKQLSKRKKCCIFNSPTHTPACAIGGLRLIFNPQSLNSTSSNFCVIDVYILYVRDKRLQAFVNA